MGVFGCGRVATGKDAPPSDSVPALCCVENVRGCLPPYELVPTIATLTLSSLDEIAVKYILSTVK